MLTLAEISDKTPSVPFTLAISAAIVVLAICVARGSWWFVLLAFPLLAFWNWVTYAELQESHFGAQIWAEMGPSYVYGQFAAINLPPIAACLTLAAANRLRRRAATAA